MEDIINVHIFYVTLFFQIHFCSFKIFFYENKNRGFNAKILSVDNPLFKKKIG